MQDPGSAFYLHSGLPSGRPLCKYPETSRWRYGVPSHMHGLLALTVQRAAYKRVGELPADARSAEAGSEIKF